MIEQQSPAGERETRENEQEAKPRWAPVRARAWMIGLLLIPLINYWAEYTEIVSQGPSLISMSLPVGCAFLLLVIIPINLLIKRFAPREALSQSELILIFVMNTVSIGIGGVGFMQFLTPILVGWKHFASDTNHWSIWHHLIPTWAVASPNVIPDYYNGGTSFFTREHVLGWLSPILVWSGFLGVLYTAIFCIAVLMRRQWVENERLSFPIVQIPLAITANGGDTPLWRDRLFWAGVGLPVVMETLNTLHFTCFPSLPYVRLKPDPSLQLDLMITQPPWSGMGYMVFSFYPVVIGLTYLLPVDVSFSCWFFYLMTKLENVATVALGFRGPGAGPALAAIPYLNEQAIGAFIGLSLLAVYWARPALKASFRKAFLGDRSVDDFDEPISYRAAYIGLILSACLLVGFGVALGLSVLVSVEFFGLFLVMGLAVTRIRAEAGLPWVFAPDSGPHGAIINFGGTAALKPQEMTGLTFLTWTDTDWRTFPQPHQLEAMKLTGAADGLRMNPRLLTVAVVVATLVALTSAWISCLTIYYKYGGDTARLETWRTFLGNWPFVQLQGWLTHRELPLSERLGGASTGLAVVGLLSFFRTRFFWWPFHPMGYAVANTTTLNGIWFPMLLGWLAKSCIVRYGGIKGYRTFLPFFLGLTLGEYGISGILAIISLVTGTTGYRTYP